MSLDFNMWFKVARWLKLRSFIQLSVSDNQDQPKLNCHLEYILNYYWTTEILSQKKKKKSAFPLFLKVNELET